MALITTLEQVQATGLRITNIDRGARLPDMDFAQQEYLLPHLGQTLLTALEGPDLTPEYETLLAMVQKPLAAFAYWNDLPHIHSRITDAGVRRTTTDNTPSAYRWEYEEARSYLEERAYALLEMLLAFLDTNQDDYPEWATDEDVQELRAQVLMKSGKDFSQRYRLHQPYRCYYYLVPIVHDVERLYLEPMIGAAFLQSFREKTATTELTAEEKQAMMLMKLAIAHLTIFEASKRLPCTITPLGFMVRNTPAGETNRTGADGMTPARQEVLNRAADASYVHGKKTLANLRKYLNETASPTVLEDYYTSEFYDSANTPILDRKNDTRKIFRL
jgi:hypothetical protein